jgi:hypothetical protein
MSKGVTIPGWVIDVLLYLVVFASGFVACYLWLMFCVLRALS